MEMKRLKLLGGEVSVSAEIYDLDGFSGHADKIEIIELVTNFKKRPKKCASSSWRTKFIKDPIIIFIT